MWRAPPGPRQGSSAEHLLGTDHTGRDFLSRNIYGARLSLLVGFAATTVAVAVATAVGGLSGFVCGRLDLVTQRFVDAWMAIPGLLLLMTIMSILGTGAPQIIIVLGLTYGIGSSRVIRGAVIAVKKNAYFQAAQAVGSPPWRTVLRHVLPNVLAPIIVIFSIAVGAVIITENPRAAVAPDVFVVLGVSNADRSSYRLWEERKGPDFVLEITSRTTYREDQGRKRKLYLSLGVQEYWQYDPTRDYLEPPLQGLELADGTLALGERRAGAGVAADGARAALPRSADRAEPAEPCGNRRGAGARAAGAGARAAGTASGGDAPRTGSGGSRSRGSTSGRAGGVVAPGPR